MTDEPTEDPVYLSAADVDNLLEGQAGVVAVSIAACREDPPGGVHLSDVDYLASGPAPHPQAPHWPDSQRRSDMHNGGLNLWKARIWLQPASSVKN